MSYYYPNYTASISDYIPAQYKPIIDMVVGIFRNFQEMALKLGGVITPNNPALGMLIVIVIGILLLKGKSENLWTYLIIGLIGAVVLGYWRF